MKNVTKYIVCSLATLIITLAPLTVSANEAYKKEAIEAAKKWLTLVDNGKYVESWDQAAEPLKAQVTRAEWVKKLGTALPPFGKSKERKLMAAEYAKTLPGAPDGDYVMIQFKASFEKKTGAIETITPMRGKDGKWRIAGYYIR